MTDFYEQQVIAARNQPGLSLADGTFIDNWAERARAQDRYRVTAWVRDRRERNKAKASEAMERLNTLQDQYVKVRKQAERNEVPWKELVKAQRRLNNERLKVEAVLQSLEAGEASNQRMESDPTAYMTGFYARYPTLPDQRPNLANDLFEDRTKRGVRPL
ncbi:hypothetical protein CFH99_16635 [Nocardioides aromaticivorans]|uniref:Uncharacterized protein n=1 Tax=Nocardioides aromaticivorans TaxID=200618 RepID=A0ABX7PN45_9ACTN|nr:hypothetical protein [Nocardioides aromaticivorans]QSR27249.1 hypothetical protein CFH99_16635 [Nocardioides aromaticivorans]